MNEYLPHTEIYSFPNTQVNVSQFPSFHNLNYLQYLPQFIQETNTMNEQINYPLPYSNKEAISKSQSQGLLNSFSFNNVVSEQSGMKPNITINLTIINNYMPKNKRKKQIEVDCSNDESNDSLEGKVKIDEFVSSIKMFVQQLEMNDGEQSINSHSQLFGISKRRTYDIVNVFESIGCLKKRRCDSIFWIGKDNIKNKLKYLIEIYKADDNSLSLEELFPSEKCIGVSNMTASLVILFYVLKIEMLDLRDVSNFFARNTSRYKITLNKLYQIAHIMSAIEVLKKTQTIGEVIISTDYFRFDVIPENKGQSFDFFSIESFLNTDESKLNKITLERRKEFKKYIFNNINP